MLSEESSSGKCNYRVLRVGGHQWISPLLSAEEECESEYFSLLKALLSRQIDSLQRAGNLKEASVYLRDFETGRWMSINGSARYHPASLMKVALLISVLKAAEAQPGLLQQKIEYTAPPPGVIQPQYYLFDTIQVGQSYTVAELLERMMVYSDNHATWLLASRLNPQSTPKLFTDIGLEVPLQDKVHFTMSAPEIAVLFKVIFNASYLSAESSEYAAQLMARCAFAEGFKKGMPQNARMWHKFGEWRYAGHLYELHEAGVFYIDKHPYLVVILTRGVNTDRQAQSIATLSHTLYDWLYRRERSGNSVSSLSAP